MSKKDNFIKTQSRKEIKDDLLKTTNKLEENKQELIGLKKELEEAKKEVKEINNLKDFKEETNHNLRIYFGSAIGLIALFAVAMFYVLPLFAETFYVYKLAISLTEKTTSQILSIAFGLFLLKVPFALVLGGFITGFYKLMKSILFTYEKINKDKRNTSAIMAIVNRLNMEASSIILGKEIDWDDFNNKDKEETEAKLKDMQDKIKWNEISNYFARMHESNNAKDGEGDGDVTKQIESAINIVDKITTPIIAAIRDKK